MAWRITRKRRWRRDPSGVDDFGSAKATKLQATREVAQEAEKKAKEEARYAKAVYAKSTACKSTAWDRVAAHYAVAADAWEEAGNKSKSLDMKWHMKRALRKGSFAGKPLSKERVERFYKFHRRQGKTPAQATRLAKIQASRRIIGYIGDRDWIGEGGGPVYQDQHGDYQVEWVERMLPGYRRPYRIYRVPLEREPIPDWINVAALANFTGISRGVIRKRWASPRAMERAQVLWVAAQYYGWGEFDSYPFEMTRKEVQERYRKRVPKNDPSRVVRRRQSRRRSR